MAQYTIDNQPARIDWETRDPIARTLQNAKNLLMTRMGEVPFDRLRGLNPDVYDEPVTLLQQSLAQEVDRVFLWEPGVSMEEARCRMDDAGEAVVEVVVEIEEYDSGA